MFKISVIVPVYNVEKYISQCVESILAQTFTNFELLLVDDGSKDSSGAICDEYAEKDSRIRVFHTENRGVSAARNLGIKEASADWICFVDSDDWVENDYLSTFCQNKRTENSIIYQRITCDFEMYPNKNIPYFIYEDKFIRSNQIQKYLVSYRILSDGYITAKLYNKTIIQENHIEFCEDLDLFEDLLFVRTYLRFVDEIRLYSNISYHYMKRESMTLATKQHSSEEYLYVSKKLLECLDLLLKRFPIDDELYLKEMYTLHGLSQLFSACRTATRKNYKYVFNTVRKQKELFDKYYKPKDFKHKVFCKMIFCKCIPCKIVHKMFILYNRKIIRI